ncbi:MAG: hypothetical protein K0S60_301 [Evtepia sp.]|jgi:hypothetical protein|nr:hypothetical protein [Evtepia sp.]
MDKRQNRRIIEWGKNLLILFLVLSTVYLISQSTLYDGFGIFARSSRQDFQSSQTEAASTMERHVSIEPIRLAVHNQSGCYGVQYDQQTIDLLFETKLSNLLREALTGAEHTVTTTEEQWKAVLSGESNWVYFDFLTNLPLSDIGIWLESEKNPALSGMVRRVLLTESGGKHLLYYCNEEDGQYYFCEWPKRSEDQFRSVVNEFVPNGAAFAFQKPDTYGTLKYDVMILPTVPNMPVYDVKNPLETLQEGEQEKILRSLLFNPQAVSFYQSADGLVIQEGVDTLRILKKGTITFHSQGAEQVRYPILRDDPETLVEITQKLFLDIVADRCGEGVPYLIGVNTQKDGSIVVSFGYRLNGAPVQVFSQGYAAQFLIRDGSIHDFTIHVRQYTNTDEKAVVLPEKQAAAAAKKLEQQGKELLLTYLDSGEKLRISANWSAH